MIDTDRYNIDDDVVWIWNDYPDDEGWVLWEYKECPAEKGGYPVGNDRNKTYEPRHQVLPSLIFECKIDERMNAITDLPLIIQEVRRLRSYIAHHDGDVYRQCPECGSLDFTFRFDDEGMHCDCDACDNEWKVKIE